MLRGFTTRNYPLMTQTAERVGAVAGRILVLLAMAQEIEPPSPPAAISDRRIARRNVEPLD
jgi:hypothetical protein